MINLNIPKACAVALHVPALICSASVPQINFSWVTQLLMIYPELSWLADDSVVITQEGKASLQESPSVQVFGKKYVEFDRTLLTIYSLNLILDGSEAAYDIFTQAQSEKLSRHAFHELHNLGTKLLNHPSLSPVQVKKLMEVALVLGDMGKTRAARQVFSDVTAIDHDDFEHAVLLLLKDNPARLRIFADLQPEERDILIHTTGLAHFGHISHLEGGPEMFSGLKILHNTSLDAEYLLEFALFVHRCDVAGALGHVNPYSSIVFNEATFNTYEAVAQASRIMLDPSKTEEDAYREMLVSRSMYLDPSKSEDRILIKIAAMLRLSLPSDALIMQKAFFSLPLSDQQLIIQTLSCDQVDTNRLTPTYMPAVLINLMNNTSLGATRDARLSAAITVGLPIIAKALYQYREHIDPSIRLCFNPLAGQAKSSDILQIKDKAIYIDDAGDVLLKV